MKVCVGLYDSVGKKVVSFLSWYYEKMKTSISARKLFTLILVMVLLAVQYVDYETTLSAVRANHLIGEASSFLKMDKTGMGSCLWNAWEKNLLFLPSQTPYNLIMVNLLCTFLLFNYRIAENVLTCLNQKKVIFPLSAAVSVALILIDGRLLIGSECIYILLGAGAIFPKFVGHGQDGSKESLRHIVRELREWKEISRKAA